jgi:hypothetical protein
LLFLISFRAITGQTVPNQGSEVVASATENAKILLVTFIAAALVGHFLQANAIPMVGVTLENLGLVVLMENLVSGMKRMNALCTGKT